MLSYESAPFVFVVDVLKGMKVSELIWKEGELD